MWWLLVCYSPSLSPFTAENVEYSNFCHHATTILPDNGKKRSRQNVRAKEKKTHTHTQQKTKEKRAGRWAKQQNCHIDRRPNHACVVSYRFRSRHTVRLGLEKRGTAWTTKRQHIASPDEPCGSEPETQNWQMKQQQQRQAEQWNWIWLRKGRTRKKKKQKMNTDENAYVCLPSVYLCVGCRGWSFARRAAPHFWCFGRCSLCAHIVFTAHLLSATAIGTFWGGRRAVWGMLRARSGRIYHRYDSYVIVVSLGSRRVNYKAVIISGCHFCFFFVIFFCWERWWLLSSIFLSFICVCFFFSLRFPFDWVFGAVSIRHAVLRMMHWSEMRYLSKRDFHLYLVVAIRWMINLNTWSSIGNTVDANSPRLHLFERLFGQLNGIQWDFFSTDFDKFKQFVDSQDVKHISVGKCGNYGRLNCETRRTVCGQSRFRKFAVIF